MNCMKKTLLQRAKPQAAAPGFPPGPGPRPLAPAFTMVELLVAIGITSIMLLIIGKVFTETSGAITRGVALSDVMAKARHIGEQIEEDTSEMLGPGTAGNNRGFLCIINDQIVSVPMVTPAGEVLKDRRADILLFVRKAEGMTSLVGKNDSTYAPGSEGSLEAAHALVWYGICRRTNPDGTDSGALGAKGISGTGKFPDLNLIGTHWVLGRHAMLLSRASTTPSGGDIGPYVSGTNGIFTLPFSNAQMVGLTVPGTVTNAASRALADIGLCYADDGGTLVGGLGALVSDAGPIGYLDLEAGADHSAGDDLDYPAYHAKAFQFAFAGDDRLRVNTSVKPQGGTEFFETWQLAQTHPMLGTNISEFEVQFAADVEYNTALDGEPDTTASGDLKWYDMETTSWGTHPYHARTRPNNIPPGDDEAYVWRHNDVVESRWPYMLRILFTVHDKKGLLGQDDPDGTGSITGKRFEVIVHVER